MWFVAGIKEIINGTSDNNRSELTDNVLRKDVIEMLNFQLAMGEFFDAFPIFGPIYLIDDRLSNGIVEQPCTLHSTRLLEQGIKKMGKRPFCAVHASRSLHSRNPFYRLESSRRKRLRRNVIDARVQVGLHAIAVPQV